VPDVAFQLALLLKDGHVPGFYDGQFASVAGRFDELAALASQPEANHVLRVMAVMALQEAASGEKLAAVLEPLIMPAREEVQTDYDDFLTLGRDATPDLQRRVARADLSQHARFSLAKAGQPTRVLDKITEMQIPLQHRLPEVLDPDRDADRDYMLSWYRQLIFDIGYHYQQFDDYEHASEWFHKLTDELPGHSETSWAHYDLACIDALQGRPEQAVEHLKAAFAVGFTDVNWMLQDGDLKSLRERPDFQALAERMRNGGLTPPALPGPRRG
jgi:tetratricopeptide (TPR) repeat protein